jgi:hypothetical protein
MSTKRPSALGRGSFLSAGSSPTPKPEHPEKPKSERAKISLEIRLEFHRELKKLAAEQDRKMYELVDEALGRYLSRAS